MAAGHYQFTSLVPAADDNKPSQPAALQSRPELESQVDTHTLRRRQSFTYADNSLDLPTQQVFGWAPLGQPPGGAALQQTPPAALPLVAAAAATEGAAPSAAAAHNKVQTSQKTSPAQPLTRVAAPVLKAYHKAVSKESVAQRPSVAAISALQPSASVLHDTGNPQASRMDEMAKGLSQHTGKAGSGTSLIQRRKAESVSRKQAHAAPNVERASSSAATLQQAASVSKPVNSGRLSVQKQAATAKVAVSSESLAPVGSRLGEALPKGQ